MSDLFRQTGATFSACRKYRYRLWRRWADSPPLAFVMLNPSTADEVKNDPTVERCERRAKQGGYGGVAVVNLFAYRSTDPRELFREDVEPVGPENDAHILGVARTARCVVCAWGLHGSFRSRGWGVIQRLKEAGITPYALKVGRSGTPLHPLYLPYTLEPKPLDVLRYGAESLP